VWVQQYVCLEGVIRWRDSDSTPPSAVMISSPYDTQAHYARKRSTSWIGYKVHLTETCDEAAALDNACGNNRCPGGR
jgi:transposase